MQDKLVVRILAFVLKQGTYIHHRTDIIQTELVSTRDVGITAKDRDAYCSDFISPHNHLACRRFAAANKYKGA